LGLVAIEQVKKCVALLSTKYSPEVTSVEFRCWPGDISFYQLVVGQRIGFILEKK